MLTPERQAATLTAGQQATPVRLQRRRAKGFRLVSPNGLPIVCVTRPSKWGNPTKVGSIDSVTGRVVTQGAAARLFKLVAMQSAFPELRRMMREELAGKNIACYCPLNCPCHGDIILAIANSVNDDDAFDASMEVGRRWDEMEATNASS